VVLNIFEFEQFVMHRRYRIAEVLREKQYYLEPSLSGVRPFRIRHFFDVRKLFEITRFAILFDIRPKVLQHPVFPSIPARPRISAVEKSRQHAETVTSTVVDFETI
jgi:hypothetical protein